MKYLLLLLFAFCSFAFGGEVTVLVGESTFTVQNDGIWYQKAFSYELNNHSGSFGIRYDSPVTNTWSYSIGYMYLGKVSSLALATGIDGNHNEYLGYNPVTRSCNDGPCGYISQWEGHGDVQGIFSSLVKNVGDWGFEIGLYLYKPTWEVHIPNWVGECRGCAPIDVTVQHAAHWQVGPMLGIRYKLDDKWSFNASTWHTASEGDEWTSLYHNQTYNFSIGYTF